MAAASLCAVGISALASTSNMTATVTDTDATAWGNCSYTAILTILGGASTPAPTIGGVTVSPLVVKGSCSNSGVITAALTDTSSVDQKNVQWVFQVQSNTSAPPVKVSTPVVGAAPNLTSAFSILSSPRFATGNNAYGYADVEIQGVPLVGATYYNVTTPCFRQFSLAGWTCGSGSTSTPFPGAVQASSVAPGSSSTGSKDNASVFTAALAGGNKKITVNGAYAVGSTIPLPSGSEIDCTPGSGFIELAGTDAPMFMNATSIATPTACAANVADGNGGFIVSHQCDKNITIKGCILNFNSAQSVTNPDHKTSPAGFWITGVQMLGVDNLQFIGNTTYDSPTYNFAVNNVSNFKFNENTILEPLTGGLPTTGKNTDGLHVDGPAIYGQENNNTLTTGDDAIALNADDGYRPGTGCSCAMVAYPGWTWGPINNVSAEGNVFVNAYSGVRLLSSISRLDEVHLNNNTGTVMDMILLLDHEFYPGVGNFGSVDVNNLDVQRGSFSGPSEHPGNIYLQGNIGQLTFNGLKIHDVQTARPEILQSEGTIGNLHFTGTDIANPTGVQNSSAWFVLNTGVSNLNVSSTSLTDAANNSGALIGGLVIPSTITASGYNGPNRLLFPGFAPAIKNGDAFTNTYPAGKTVYLNTMFDEHATGDLAGTIPAVTVAGHAWAESGAGGWAYTNGMAVGSSTITSFATVDLGVTTGFVARMNLAQLQSGPLLGGQFIFRYTDTNNYDVVDFSGPGEITIASVVAGAVQQQINNTACTTGNANSLVVTVTGNVVNGVVNGGCSLSMTLTDTANFAATKIGMNNTTTQGNQTSILSLSVAAQ